MRRDNMHSVPATCAVMSPLREPVWSSIAAMLAIASLPAQAPLRALLPADCAIAVEVRDAGRAFDRIAAAVGDLPVDLPMEVRTTIGAGLLALPVLLGAEPRELVAGLAGGGAALGLAAVDGRPEPLLVLQPPDVARAARWLERRETTMQWELVGERLLIARSPGALERLRQGVAAHGGRFGSHRAAGDGAVDAEANHDADTVVAEAFVDLEELRRQLPALREPGRGLDGAGRFLLGGIADALRDARTLTATLHADDALRLQVAIDAGVPAQWRELMPARGEARPAPPAPPGTLLSIGLDRGLHALFAAPGRHLRPEQVTQLQSFLSIADQIDGNSSFVDDLLGNLREPWHLFVLGADEDAIDPADVPDLLLPGFALVAGVRDEVAERVLRRMAQVFVVIANAERMQRRDAPFVLRALRAGEAGGFVARPLPWRGPGRPPTEQALSPTLAFGSGHCVLASTESAACAVLDAIAEAGDAAPVLRGDVVELHGAALARLIRRDAGPLALARMLDEGETRAEAERFFAVAAATADAFDARLEITADADATRLSLEVRRR